MSVTDLIPRNWIWWRKEKTPAAAQTREDNLDPFLNFQREVNRLFDDFFRSVPARLPFSSGLGTGFLSLPLSGAIWPNVEIAETGHEIRVTAEIPGLSEKDVELLLEDDRLVIRGERSQHIEDKDRQFSERFLAASSVISRCRPASRRIRPRRASTMACWRSPCRKRRRLLTG